MTNNEQRRPRVGSEVHENTRFLVLELTKRECGGEPGRCVTAWSFAEQLGIWQTELFRIIDFLDRAGYLDYCGGGPQVALTQKGLDYLVHDRGRRETIRS